MAKQEQNFIFVIRAKSHDVLIDILHMNHKRNATEKIFEELLQH
jgi:hypothetical protein